MIITRHIPSTLCSINLNLLQLVYMSELYILVILSILNTVFKILSSKSVNDILMIIIL